MSTHAAAVGTQAHEVRCLNLADGTLSLLSLCVCVCVCVCLSHSLTLRADTVTTVGALAQGKLLLLGEPPPRTKSHRCAVLSYLSTCLCGRAARQKTPPPTGARRGGQAGVG